MEEKKIESTLDAIASKLDNQKWLFCIINKGQEVKIAAAKRTREEAENIFYEKIKDKTEYSGCPVFRVNLHINKHFIANSSKFVAGPLSYHLKEYVLDSNLKLKHFAEHAQGTVWYTNEDILANKFKTQDLRGIILSIHKHSLDILNIAGVNACEVLDYLNTSQDNEH